MAARDSGLVANFSEDLQSSQATVCGRQKCRKPIAAGEAQHYITGANAQNGKFVCTPCINYYGSQPGTMSRKDFEASQARSVKESVNNARRKDATRSSRRVTPLPPHIGMGGSGHNPGMMLPPPVPPQPGVSIPSSWHSAPYTYPPPPPAPPVQHPSNSNMYGYTAAHAQYGASRQLWAGRAYQSSIADAITLRFKVLHETHGKKDGTQVRNLSEGKPNVLAISSPTALRQLAIETMHPKICLALNDCPIDWKRIVLPEISNWVDLGQEPPHDPYFYHRCLTGKPKGKDGVATFKKPTKAFELALVIDAEQWEEICQYLAQKDSMSVGESSKRQRSPSVPRTPPQSKRRAIQIYQSPNRDQLRDALLESGSSHSQLSEQPFRITNRPLQELMAPGGFQGFTCDLADAARGSLVLESGKWLGISTFKTASPGYLTLMHLGTDGLGRQTNETVAVKRMYVRRAMPTEANPNGWAINRLTAPDEYRKTLMEANLLLWADSIMDLTYSFIHHSIENSAQPPPFEIPEVRFVHAGVAVVHRQITGPVTASTSTLCRTYLIEELIDEQKDGFYKFINNSSAVPLPSMNESVSALAEFLSFTQHVQYHKTKALIYLSDLQGTLKLLTDSQIMTAPSIGEGVEIWGEGNVPAAFNAFPEQHVCNKFCTWFQLPSALATAG
ncbi:hypothetical protein B0H19DRAFT_1348962 [Mycena capillaripes]|nr:hypothetical protein B0H19DRAFT_1348962 [Mycena capillaripes]